MPPPSGNGERYTLNLTAPSGAVAEPSRAFSNRHRARGRYLFQRMIITKEIPVPHVKLFTREFVLKIHARRFTGLICARRGSDPFEPLLVARRLAGGIKDAPKNGCWEWVKALGNKGYARVGIHKGCFLAHRVAYHLSVESVPVHLVVLHECDNPKCINPKHLRLGTQSENLQDAVAKGRWNSRAGGLAVRGEISGAAVLKTADVIKIRAMFAAGQSGPSIGKAIGISTSQTYRVRDKASWAHVK